MRIGIAGAGIAGLALAWLLDDRHDVVLLEERGRLGGNLESVLIHHGGRRVCADIGVRETPAEDSTLWRTVARLAGFPAEQVTFPASRTVFRNPGTTPLWRYPGQDEGPVPGSGPGNRALSGLAEEAARRETENLSWDLALGQLLDKWSLTGTPAAEAVCALPASLHGCTLDEARGLSARSVGSLLGEMRPAPHRPATTTLLREGTGGLAHALASGLRSASVHLGLSLGRLTALDCGLGMIDTTGSEHAVDAVVLALPADRAAKVLGTLPGAEGVRAALARVPYRDLVYGLHLDPFGMPADRRAWAATNVSLHGRWSESTNWYGPAPGADLFVSQLTQRTGTPRLPLATSHFRTRLPTPSAHRAADLLRAAQGRGGIFLAGHCATHDDTQESALASAVSVAERLAPDSRRLCRLRTERREEVR